MSSRSPGGEAPERLGDLEAKVEKLRRVNAELGRELRRGAVSVRPRTPAVAARALAKLTNERDTARADLERTETELAETRASLEAAEQGVTYLSEQFDGLRLETERLRLETERLRHEAARLRSGGAGLLRRLRARLLRR